LLDCNDGRVAQAVDGGLVLAAAGATVVAGSVAWVLDRRRRAMTDRATTPAAAVFAGRNEVEGRAWAAAPLVSHRSATPSITWGYVLEEERSHTRTVTSTDAQGRSSSRQETYRQWHEIDRRGASLRSFEVVDGTGSVVVDLDGADVVRRPLHEDTFRDDGGRGFIASLFDNRTGRYRERESGVAVGDRLFVVGDAVLDETTCTPVLRDRVLVSTRSESSHTAGLGAGVACLVAVAVAGACATGALLVAPGAPTDPTAWLPGLAVAVVLLLAAWVATSYNRLRLVAQGADRAWSLVDVQLQRRHDLVPSLAAVITAHVDHERGLLQAAARRDAGPAGEGAADLAADARTQRDELRRLLAVADAAPSLTTDASFQRLRAEIGDCETRIAASRSFYNDSLTLLRDRASSFPDLLVARRIGLVHGEHLGAAGFEPTVDGGSRSFA